MASVLPPSEEEPSSLLYETQQLFLAEKKGKSPFSPVKLQGSTSRHPPPPPPLCSNGKVALSRGLKRIDLYTSLYPSIDRHYFKIRTFIEFTSGFETGTKIYRVTVGGGSIEVERGIL